MKKIKEKICSMKKGTLLLTAVLIILAVTAFSMAIQAKALDGYRLEEGNNLTWERVQNKGSDSATMKYSTKAWWFFPKEHNFEDTSVTLDTWTNTWQGFSLSTKVIDPGEPDEDGIYTETVQVKAGVLVPKVKQWAEDGYFTRKQMTEGITVYASPLFQVLYKGREYGPYYNALDILNAPNKIVGTSWSSNTQDVLAWAYNKAIDLTFEYTNFSIEFVDTSGTQVEGFSCVDPCEGFVIYGEEIDIPAFTGENNNVTYSHYYWSDDGQGGKTKKPSKKEVSYEKISKSNYKEGLILYFVFNSKSVTDTPAPEVEAATPIPPDATITPAEPTPPPPTEEPEPPAPTNQPNYDVNTYESRDMHYSTTDGHAIWDIMQDSGSDLANYIKLTGSGNFNELVEYINENFSTRTSPPLYTTEYKVGTDSNGNEWYFIAGTGYYGDSSRGTGYSSSSSNRVATYVHPKTYGSGSTKYAVDSPDVRYISELTFPKTITSGGLTYYVASIGGAGDKYYTSRSSTYYSPDITLSMNHTTGSYYWSEGSEDAALQKNNEVAVDYNLGIIGNGSLTSRGARETGYVVGGGSRNYYYEYNYYVYNTTLTTITIPDSVIKIWPNAFRNCQALVKINGGECIQDICDYEFAVITDAVAGLSYVQTENYGGGNKDIFKQYNYYNNSYSKSNKTSVMLDWENHMKIGPYMPFPDLPFLKTLGAYSFSGRSHLTEVTLDSKVTNIYENAFNGCKLNKIVIPSKDTQVHGAQETLGTKGWNQAAPTVIETMANSPAYAMNYGFEYYSYYTVKAGFSTTYYPNGGTPDSPITEASELAYREATFTENLVTLDSSSENLATSTRVTYIDKNGYLLFGKIIKNSNKYYLSTTIKSDLLDYSFTKLESCNYIQSEDAFALFAYDANGTKYLLAIPVSTTPTSGTRTFLSFLSRYVEPSPVKKLISGTIKQKTSNYKTTYVPIIRYLAENGKVYSYNGTSWSMASLPCLAKDVVATGGNDSLSVYSVLGQDGSLYARSHTSNEFTLVDTGDVEIDHLGKISLSAYFYTLVYATDGTVYNVTNDRYSGKVTLELFNFSDMYEGMYENSETVHENMNGYFVYYNAANDSLVEQYDTKIEINRSANGKLYYKCHYRNVKNGSNVYEISDWLELPNGTGEFLASCPYTDPNVSAGYGGRFAVYYTDSEGHIYRTAIRTRSYTIEETNQLAGGTAFTDVFLLSMADAGSPYDFSYSTPVQSSTWEYDRRPVVKLVALDAEGYVWEGFYVETPDGTYTGGLETKELSKKLSRTYTDVRYKVTENETETSESIDTDGNGSNDRTNSETTKTETYHIYLLGTDKNVYVYSKTSYDYKQISERTTTSSGSYGEYTTTVKYDISNTFGRQIRNYEKDVEKLLAYPYVWFADETVGYLENINLSYNIFSGAIFPLTIAPNRFTKDGSDFSHWNTKADGTGTSYDAGQYFELDSFDETWKTQSPLAELYAQWVGATPKPKYIFYNSNGGGGTMAATEVPVGTTSATLAQNQFTRKGYRFAGWNTKANGSGTSYTDKATIRNITENITLYAKWTPYTYTVKFAGDEIRITPVTILSALTKTLTFNESLFMPEEPYQKNYTVSYNLNPGNQSTVSTIAWVTAQPLADKYTKAVFDFVGWSMYRQNGSNYSYLGRRFAEFEEVRGLTNIDRDVLTMFPVWGGVDSRVRLPEATMDGYILAGWMDGRTEMTSTEIAYMGGESADESGSYMPKGNETLYALWSPLTKNITLDATNYAAAAAGMSADVTQTQNVVNIVFDAVAPAVEAPTCSRWIFMGYYTELGTDGTPTADSIKIYDTNRNADGTYAVTVEGVIVMNNLNGTFDDIDTLYAYWVPDKAVVYDANYSPLDADCPTMETTWVDFDKTYVDLPANQFTRTGYTFSHWNTKADGTGTSYADCGRVKNITGRVTLYAQWTPNPYTIAYNLKGNKPNASSEILMPTAPTQAVYDTAFTVSNPSRKGYDFIGWDISGMDNCTHTIGGSTTTATSLTGITDTTFKNLHSTSGVVTFKAHWEVKTYLVTLDDRGATSTSHTESVTMTYDADCPTIIVPTKTGYTFEGYYTGIRGTGKQYYDKDGISAAPWTEEDVDVLYAYWIQDDVELPEEDEYTEPEVEDEETIEGNIGRNDAKALLYADDYDDTTGALTDLQPYLTYNTPATTGVIPGTEYLSFRAKVGSWMLNYKFHKNTGKDYVNITVTVPYRTQYEIKETEELVISDLQTKDYTFAIPKTWSYWEIVESGMYYPDGVVVKNDMFKNGNLTVPVIRDGADSVNAPEYSATTYGGKTEHVEWPDYGADGAPVLTIVLTEEQYIISEVWDTLPDVDAHNVIVAKNAARADDREAEVRSDRYEFDGTTLLSDAWQTKNGASLDTDNLPENADDVSFTTYPQTYATGIELDELKPNGRYNTTAEITYVGDASNIGAAPTKTVPLTDINDLNIHTPVACDGVITDGVEYTKDEEGNELAVLTLKDALNFFALRIDNTGTHLMSLGYGYKNFATALSGKSNVAMDSGSMLNQVQFPFDVYVDMGNNSLKADGTYDTTGDYVLLAGEWFTTGVEQQSFYVPVTAKNGKYSVCFRSIAVNSLGEERGQSQVNLNQQHYMATDSLELEVESYLKEFRIVSVEDPRAAEQLEKEQMVTLKKGYGFNYQLLTQGEFFGDNVEMKMIPKYYLESEEGIKRQEVVLYRLDELISGKNRECYAWDTEPILLLQENYDVILQKFSGRGLVPADVLCVPLDRKDAFETYTAIQTITGKEDFFKRSGRLFISFEIHVKSNSDKWYFLETGDVICYDLARSIEEDYEIKAME